MENFKELQEALPEVAKKLVTMSKEDLIERLAELEIYKDHNEFFAKDLEHIINLGLHWLKDNDKTNHYIYIEHGKTKLVQKEVIETKFI